MHSNDHPATLVASPWRSCEEQPETSLRRESVRTPSAIAFASGASFSF